MLKSVKLDFHAWSLKTKTIITFDYVNWKHENGTSPGWRRVCLFCTVSQDASFFWVSRLTQNDNLRSEIDHEYVGINPDTHFVKSFRESS